MARGAAVLKERLERSQGQLATAQARVDSLEARVGALERAEATKKYRLTVAHGHWEHLTWEEAAAKARALLDCGAVCGVEFE